MLVLLAPLALSCGAKKKQRIEQSASAAELGRAKLTEGKSEEAVADLTKAHKLDPKNAEITHLLGLAYWSKSKVLGDESMKLEAEKLVLQSFEQIGEENVSGEWRNNLGALYVDMTRYPDAVIQLQKAIKDPNYRTPERPLNNLAKASLEQKKCQEAVEYADRALKVQPRFCMALINKGDAERCLGKRVDALDSFIRVTKEEECQNWPEPYLKLGLVNGELKKKTESRQFLQKAKQLDPDGPHGKEAEKLLRLMGN